MALELGACSILELTQLRLHFSNIRDNCSSVAKKKTKKRIKLDIVASKIVLLKEHMIYCKNKKKLDRAGERLPPRHYN